MKTIPQWKLYIILSRWWMNVCVFIFLYNVWLIDWLIECVCIHKIHSLNSRYSIELIYTKKNRRNSIQIFDSKIKRKKKFIHHLNGGEAVVFVCVYVCMYFFISFLNSWNQWFNFLAFNYIFIYIFEMELFH